MFFQQLEKYIFCGMAPIADLIAYFDICFSAQERTLLTISRAFSVKQAGLIKKVISESNGKWFQFA